MQIKPNMPWPPMDYLSWKMAEHSAWYSSDAETLANFYTEWGRADISTVQYPLQNNESFWGRQIKNQGEIFVHVPLASDIAETSASFLFGEAPIIRVAQANELKANPSYKSTQQELTKMLDEIQFNSKLNEAAESCSAIGGIYIKIALDSDLSPYPIPVIEQADKAIPEFKFGILTAVTFWKVIDKDESNSKVYRLLERYDKGSISYSLWLGTGDRLGTQVDLKAHPDTSNYQEMVTTIDELLVVYVPNMLPNRLNRSSSLGRSDLLGLEGLMDSLDEVYSGWIRDVALAQAKILLPESYLRKTESGFKYNIDKMLYVKLDMDPLTEGNKITPQQFAIRAEEFEKTSLNLLERIITSAGYSPQSFGLNIQGRAESGTALSMRERKSFATKNKKQNYWQAALQRLVKLLMLCYRYELKGKIDTEVDINIEFNDGVTNNLSELSQSVQMIANASAASTETKVRILHPDWDEEQIQAEVNKIQDENKVTIPDGFGNLDISQLNNEGSDE